MLLVQCIVVSDQSELITLLLMSGGCKVLLVVVSLPCTAHEKCWWIPLDGPPINRMSTKVDMKVSNSLNEGFVGVAH